MLTLEIKLILLAVAFAGLAGGGWFAHHHIYQSGFDDSKAISDKERAVERATAQVELIKANEKVRDAQLSLTSTLEAIDAKTKELQNAKAQLASLRADLRAGTTRLSIPIAPGSCRDAGSPSGPGAASGTSTEAHAELLPTTADDIVGIAADANDEVRRTNECIDRYEAVRAAVNGATP